MEGNKMKLINSSKSKEKPLLGIRGTGLKREVILMDKFTWEEILRWSKEYSKKQLEFPFK
jgi:hypothetical protein